MKFFDYFQSLGFSQKESEIYLALYQLWVQPASIIAKYVKLERTSVYKILLSFAEKNLVAVTDRNGVKHFFIPDISVIRQYVENESSRLETMKQEYATVAMEIESHRKNAAYNMPKITLYEGEDGMRNCYENIYTSLKASGYRSCQLFASNTLHSRSGKSHAIEQYADAFFDTMKEEGFLIEAILGNGIDLMETIGRVSGVDELRSLPAANESIQIFIAGTNTYIIIFREIPFAMKISSNELAQVFRFLLEKMNSLHES